MTLMTGGRVTILTALIAVVLSVQCAMAKDVPAAERDVADILSAVIKYERPEDNDGNVDCLYKRRWDGFGIPKSDMQTYLNRQVEDYFVTTSEKPAEYFLLMAGVPREQICGIVTRHPTKVEIHKSLWKLILQGKVEGTYIVREENIDFNVPAFNKRRDRVLIAYSHTIVCYSLKKNGELHSGLAVIYNSVFFLEKSSVWKVVKKIPNGIGDGFCEENE